MLEDQPYYYVKNDDITSGPISWDGLKVWAKEGEITESTKIWSSTTNIWTRADEIDGIEPVADESIEFRESAKKVVKTFLGLLIMTGRRVRRAVRG